MFIENVIGLNMYSVYTRMYEYYIIHSLEFYCGPLPSLLKVFKQYLDLEDENTHTYREF